MRKLLSVTAMLLALTLAVMMPMPALAATKTHEYVSELVAVAAKDEAKARGMLESSGYTLVPGDLNSSLSTDVYLGYKTTDDPEKAITNISAMNMTGNYSYSSYKDILKRQRSIVNSHIGKLLPAIDAFQVNYGKGSRSAQYVYELLNCYTENVVNQSCIGMGDYLLSYRDSDATRAELTDVFMKGNSDIIVSIEQLLSITADVKEETLVDRWQKLEYDELEDRYIDEYRTVTKARAAMKAAYGDTIADMMLTWDEVGDYLREVEEKYVVYDGDEILPNESALEEYDGKAEDVKWTMSRDEKEILNSMAAAVDYINVTNALNDFALFKMMAETELPDGSTALELFMTPAKDIRQSDLYTFAESLSTAQRTMLGVVGVRATLLNDYSAVDNVSDEDMVRVRELAGSIKAEGGINVYEDVDLSIFDDGVAFTDAAVQHERLTGESWAVNADFGEKARRFKTLLVTTLISTVVIGCAIGVAANWGTLIAPYIGAAERTWSHMGVNPVDTIEWFQSHNYDPLTTNFETAVNSTATKCELLKNSKYIVVPVCFIITLIALAFEIYAVVNYLICETPSLRQEEPVPHHIVTVADNSDGEESYIYYEVVRNLSGIPADLNNHESLEEYGWFDFYCTRDKKAGDPIIAGSLTVDNAVLSLSEDQDCVRVFNKPLPADTSDEAYTGYKAKHCSFVLFERDADAYTASVFSDSGVAAAAAAGGVIVLAAAAAAFVFIQRKKKGESEEAA